LNKSSQILDGGNASAILVKQVFSASLIATDRKIRFYKGKAMQRFLPIDLRFLAGVFVFLHCIALSLWVAMESCKRSKTAGLSRLSAALSRGATRLFCKGGG